MGEAFPAPNAAWRLQNRSEARLVRVAVLEGFGIGFFLERDVREDITAGRLTRLLEDWTPPLADLCLYYPGRRNPSAALKAFVALARELSKKSKSSDRSIATRQARR